MNVPSSQMIMNQMIITMTMISYRHIYVRYGRDSKYHIVSSTQIPWWLRVRYENELAGVNTSFKQGGLIPSSVIDPRRLRDIKLELM